MSEIEHLEEAVVVMYHGVERVYRLVDFARKIDAPEWFLIELEMIVKEAYELAGQTGGHNERDVHDA